ncbi:MAG TPA: SpoVR family protein [Syntrophomonas sp.]|nr:SpoVR family protein [Syntrophomonas sp.]
MSSDFSIRELREWNEKIEALVEASGLQPYPQEFEICDYEEMLNYEAYLGMPARYPHWSFGKAYERKKSFYRYNLTGLPYEMVINSNPCLAYLMKDNTLLLQILTMAHVYGHNDFFRNNRLFRDGTRAELVLEMFKSHARRIRSYISDPSIGYAKVERVLDAAHALRLQCYRQVGQTDEDEASQRERLQRQAMPAATEHPLLEKSAPAAPLDLSRIPLEPEEDIIYFLIRYAPLSEWEKDILQMVREENAYFLPQMETKIMNEGWASFWHYRILNQLELPQQLYMEFVIRHNQVLRPHEGGLNPYHLGFVIFTDLEKRYPEDKDMIFKVREQERDASFIRRYLTEELCMELNLFEFNKKAPRDYVITEIADEEGWKQIRDTLAGQVGMGMIPNVKVIEMQKADRILCLEHEWEGKELQIKYAHETLQYIARLWGGKVRLRTKVRNTGQILESEA